MTPGTQHLKCSSSSHSSLEEAETPPSNLAPTPGLCAPGTAIMAAAEVGPLGSGVGMGVGVGKEALSRMPHCEGFYFFIFINPVVRLFEKESRQKYYL